jgi:hypothetical protein
MPKLELTRSAEDHRLYVLPGVGELRTGRWPDRKVQATAGGQTYTFARRGRRGRVFAAVDAFGTEVGEQEVVRLGELRSATGWPIVWRTAAWELRFTGELAGSFALARPGAEQPDVALVQAGLWGRLPVQVSTDGTADLDPGLLLFAMFGVRLVTEAMNTMAARSGGGGGGGGG